MWLGVMIIAPPLLWSVFLAVIAGLGLDLLDFLPEGEFKRGLVEEG